MTPEQMRIAIAEKRGAKWIVVRSIHGFPTALLVIPKLYERVSWDSAKDHDHLDDCKIKEVDAQVPNYPFDLNAMHEARKSVITPYVFLRVDYLNHLRKIVERRIKLQIRPVSDYDLLDAEAIEQAEAFCRATEIWKE